MARLSTSVVEREGFCCGLPTADSSESSAWSSPKSCAVWRDNVNRYRRKTGIQSDIRIVEGDAVDYEVQENDCVFFMNNPFGAPLVEMFLDKIVRSLAVKSRRVFIIYNNPRWHTAMEQRGFSPFVEIDGGECVVYRNTV